MYMYRQHSTFYTMYIHYQFYTIIIHTKPEPNPNPNQLTSWQRALIPALMDLDIQTPSGRMCDERGFTLTINTNAAYMLIYLHTDDSGTGRRSRGLNVTFTAMGCSSMWWNINCC